MILPQAECGHGNTPALRLSSVCRGKEKLPLSAESLYALIRVQARRMGGKLPIFHPAHFPSSYALKANEYTFVFSLATILRSVSRHAPRKDVHISFDEVDDTLTLTVSVPSPCDDALRRILRDTTEALSQIPDDAHLTSVYAEENGALVLRLSSPYYELEAGTLHAYDDILVALVSLAFTNAWT